MKTIRFLFCLGSLFFATSALALDFGAADQVYVTPHAGGRAQFGQVDLSQSVAVKNALPVANGGTNRSTLTTNGVLYGLGTASVGMTAAGTQYQACQAGASSVPVFDALHLDQAAAVTGVLPHGNGGTDVSAPGTSGNVLQSTGSAWQSKALPASNTNYYNVILGSAAQVTAGVATNSTFAGYTQADGDRLLILPAYATSEAWTITKKLLIQGLGNTSQVLGAITLSTGSSYTKLENFRTTSSLTINSGIVGIYASGIWFSGTNTFVDNNSTPASNLLTGMQE